MLENSFIPEQVSRKLLIVDDQPLVRDLLYDALKLKGYGVITACNGQEALEILERNTVAAVITDMKMPEMSGATLLKRIRELFPQIPVVVITAYGTVNDAVEIMKQGATDYILKPFSINKLHDIVEKSIANCTSVGGDFGDIITTDPQMLQILESVEIIATSRASIFIQGESGTGKELIAREIHKRSDRSEGTFVAINCAALPESLLESELFGHERGAFTGAVSIRIGKFELADHGTLLLDEIVEMPTSLQVKLLRVLQENEIDRIGGNAPIKIDTRIIATTNRNVKEEIEKGRFRDDLFFRLCVVPIMVPPLRERKGDVVLLINYFLDKFCRQNGKPPLNITEEAFKALETYAWPGNIRELENVVERAVMLCRDSVLSVEDFFPHDPLVKPAVPLLALVGTTLSDVERHLIMNTLEKVNGNKTRAAAILGITTRTIRNKLQQYKAKHDHTDVKPPEIKN